MFRQMTLEQLKQSAQGKKRAAIYREFPCDDVTPTQAFISLNQGTGGVLLESAVKDAEMGRYSLLAIEPFAEFRSKGGDSAFISKEGERKGSLKPLEHLREILRELRLSTHFA